MYACGKLPEIHFTNRTQGADNFTWLLGNGDVLEGATPNSYIYPASGAYEITLKASNNACSVTESKKIKIQSQEGVLANVITPNGDGKNEYLVLPYENCALEIYNRWGKIVYKSQNYTNSWGIDAENALYYYMVTLPGGNKCNGWLQVLR